MVPLSGQNCFFSALKILTFNQTTVYHLLHE